VNVSLGIAIVSRTGVDGDFRLEKSGKLLYQDRLQS
jgi:hypothetical protein